MYVRLFILFLEGLWKVLVNLQAFWLKSFYTAVSRHRRRLDSTSHWVRWQSFITRSRLESKPRNTSLYKPLCLLNLFDTTVEKSLCIENRRLSFHHHFQLAHYVKISMHGHNWNVSCFLPCKSYMVFHGRRTPYFKYSVDKDLKMEDSYSAPLMVKWEDFCFSVCLHFLPFTKKKNLDQDLLVTFVNTNTNFSHNLLILGQWQKLWRFMCEVDAWITSVCGRWADAKTFIYNTQHLAS